MCDKPRIKCGDCGHRLLVPLTDSVIYDHLAGKQTVGVYPLLEDDTCYFLAVDFDEADWQQDALAFMQSCSELGVTAALEVSRSGQGAHAWVFFAGRVSARDARRLGTAIISHTCARTRQLKLATCRQNRRRRDAVAVAPGRGQCENYGQIVVDECHHVGATSFDAILKRTKARFVLGLTATPIRRDGQHPSSSCNAGRSATQQPGRPVRRKTWR